MRRYESLDQLVIDGPRVITIGTFDGVHPGHQKILQQVTAKARQQGIPSMVMTFYPHPRMVIFPDDHNLKLLNTLSEKEALLEKEGIDELLVLPFTVEFSRMSPSAFVEQILVHQLQVKTLIIGYDHRFGRNREGDIHTLMTLGPQLGFDVMEIPAQEVDTVKVSSTKIRQALLEGDVALAMHLLGHPYQLAGMVVHGDKRGRTIGFPTANLQLLDPWKLIPANGVYAVKVLWEEQWLPAMMNIGIRPTFHGTELRLEAHILDFSGDLYGHQLTIQFFHRIRSEMAFSHIDALKSQLEADRAAVLSLFR